MASIQTNSNKDTGEKLWPAFKPTSSQDTDLKNLGHLNPSPTKMLTIKTTVKLRQMMINKKKKLKERSSQMIWGEMMVNGPGRQK